MRRSAAGTKQCLLVAAIAAVCALHGAVAAPPSKLPGECLTPAIAQAVTEVFPSFLQIESSAGSIVGPISTTVSRARFQEARRQQAADHGWEVNSHEWLQVTVAKDFSVVYYDTYKVMGPASSLAHAHHYLHCHPA